MRLILLILLGIGAGMPLAFTQKLDPDNFKQLSYRFIGPDGNRAIAIAGEPGNNNVVYIGAASGGIFKTEDQGVTWKPIFDNQEVSSIGALALAPKYPKQVWAGTGETFVIRPAHSLGDGIYKSSDAGKTWKNMGLAQSGRIGRVIVSTKDTNTVFACALGHAYGPQKERGVYRTKDGGKTWQQVLFVNEQTGANDLAINPENPDILFAGMWNININTWGLHSGGPGGGVYRSKDGGETWEPLHTKGLPGGPDTPVGKVAVAVAPGQPNIVYALFEMDSPALYRSEDSGESWKLMSRDHSIMERAPYYGRITVAPDDANEIHTISVKHGVSKDGGKTFDFGYKGGGDNHDYWIDPQNGDRQMMAHDGCASITLNRMKSFQGVTLPIAQMYHVSLDNRVPYFVYGNRQDGYSYRGPSNSLSRGIPLSSWTAVGGCESGFAKVDPFDDNIIWSGCYDGGLDVYDLRTNHARDVRVWPESGYGWTPANMKYRWHWNFPLSFSPHTPHRVYVGSQYIHKSDDFGQSWQIISPDLTTNDKTHQQNSGGIATDNLMTFDGNLLFAIEESPLQKDLIWAGTNDGQVQLTRDGGKNWENVTQNLNVPKLGTIANIEPSRYAAGTAYISVDLHQMGDFDPYILKTADFGKTWTKISDGIPKSILSFVHVVKEDPAVRGLLYAGTDNSVYVSPDDGATWSSLRLDMPPAPVYWLEVQKDFGDLVVATYGRGFYILDDLTPVREMAKTRLAQSTLLLIRKGYRFQEVESRHTESTLSDGRGPSYGVPIQYYLKDTLIKAPEIRILQNGKEIRTVKGTNKPGINRVWWDLRYESPERPKLRTLPPGKTWVPFGKDSTRTLLVWDIDIHSGLLGPRVAPGTFTAQMNLGGQELTQPIEILKDPNTAGTLADIQAQETFSLELRAAQNQVVQMINDLEKKRAKMDRLLPQILDKKVQPALEKLNAAATQISAQLYDIHLTGAREDAFRNPIQLYGRLGALASDIGANGVDFPPTSQQREVFDLLKAQVSQARQAYDTLIKNEVPGVEKALTKKNKAWVLE
ncbi:WD40/YVTN/BNR-like repeat-containing protein [Salmonirosea aquatica]|uniref:Glycosyl hydrolase n=1 Tax=Salmonirosea aquatica TaxID=2654236 RepID=A0A7C9BGQ0_9BACT|nr:glycosyl hydrolase [Cytophagaceae bacterium SJW1-29]